MKKLLAGLLGVSMLAGYAGPAFAVGPIQNDISTPARVATYSVAASVTPGTTGTDFLVIGGSATAVVRIKEVTCTGVATANATQAISLIQRGTADTGGTAGAAPTKQASDSTDAASTAAALTYTAPPTIAGTGFGAVRTGYLSLAPAATPTMNIIPFFFQFGDVNDKEPTLRGVAQQFAVNLGGAVTAGAIIGCSIEYTESAN
jgi:hypothetical protein